MTATTTGVRVPGLGALMADLSRMGADLEDTTDLEAATADEVASKIAGAAPRVTGRLAGSVGPSPFGVEVSAPYAGPIQGGWPARGIEPNPFVDRGVTAAVPGVEALAVDHCREATRHIKSSY